MALVPKMIALATRSPERIAMFRSITTSRRSVPAWIIGLLVAVLLGAVAARPASAAPTPKPTIVLAHGPFADASSGSAVIPALQKRGDPVIAAANPLRGLS